MHVFDRTRFSYPEAGSNRDLRIDFLRGLVMLVVIISHLEYFSLFALFSWEHIGLVSSAEGFVGLSGLVVGIVYHNKLDSEGFKSAAQKLLKRSFQLYRVNIAVILSIPLLGILSFVNVYDVSHWMSPGTRSPAFALYPPPTSPWHVLLIKAFLLQIGPHQFQVIGLYVVLMACAPIALYLMHKKQTSLVIVVSWTVYLINQIMQHRLTGARFEWAFPILTWQLLFYNCMVVGYHRQAIANFLDQKKVTWLMATAATISFFFLFVTLNNPKILFWPWQPLGFIEPDFFRSMHVYAFNKNRLGVGRVFNNVILYILAYGLLTYYWRLFDRAIGWLLIPLGQASLYVFIVHVYLVLIVTNTPLLEYDNFYLNSFMHAASILTIWLMVKNRFLYRFIPR